MTELLFVPAVSSVSAWWFSHQWNFLLADAGEDAGRTISQFQIRQERIATSFLHVSWAFWPKWRAGNRGWLKAVPGSMLIHCFLIWPSGGKLNGKQVWSPKPRTISFPSLDLVRQKLLEKEHCSRKLLLPGLSQKDLSVKAHGVRNTWVERCFGGGETPSKESCLKECREVNPDSVERFPQIKWELDASGVALSYFW